MIKFNLLILSILLFSLSTHSQTIAEYMTNVKLQNTNSYEVEKAFVENYKTMKLVKELAPFYTDSLRNVRQKAYYMTYKKGLISSPKKQVLVVNKLLSGCQDNAGGIVGKNLSYLKHFPIEAFDTQAKDEIERLLFNKRMPHHDKVILLAGYIGVGQAYMHKALLDPELKQKRRWTISQALARQGDPKALEYCLSLASTVNLDNNFVLYIVPNLIYIRQKEAIDFCITILNNEEKLCNTVNPEDPSPCMCGYSVLEKLAPVIADFPWQVDDTKTLTTDNYEQALIDARVWFQENPDYQVLINRY